MKSIIHIFSILLISSCSTGPENNESTTSPALKEQECNHKIIDTDSIPTRHYPHDSLYFDLSNLDFSEVELKMDGMNFGGYKGCHYLYAQITQDCKTYRFSSSNLIPAKEGFGYVDECDSVLVIKGINDNVEKRMSYPVTYIFEFENSAIKDSLTFPNIVTIYEKRKKPEWLLYSKVKVNSMKDFLTIEGKTISGIYVPGPSDEQTKQYPDIFEGWYNWKAY